jgi:hypothetical protein
MNSQPPPRVGTRQIAEGAGSAKTSTNETGVWQSWVDKNYRFIMLLAMLVELALLGLLVVLEWMR